MRGEAYTVSVIIPVYNEQEGLVECYQRLRKVLVDVLDARWKILFVDCGSTDGSMTVLKKLMDQDKRVEIIELTRRFGKEAALSSGLDHVNADAVVLMDADLQNPPETIKEMVEHWEEGYDLIVGQRQSRQTESWWLRVSCSFFYRLFNVFSSTPILKGESDFRLMDRSVVDVIKRFPERRRFMKGLFAWSGYHPKMVSYEAEARVHGSSGFNLSRYLTLAADGLMGASSSFLKFSLFSTLIFLFLFVFFVLSGGGLSPNQGVHLVLVGLVLQMISTAVLSLYVGRIHWETKKRPLYVIKRRYSRDRKPETVHQ